MLKTATETPCFNRATSSALPLDFELHILKDGQRSNLKNIIGPAAIAKMHVHNITRTASQMTYPLKEAGNKIIRKTERYKNYCMPG